jgi:hypothetical protein
MSVFYHVTEQVLHNGDQIHPGHYGRELMSITNPSQPILFHEYVLEQARCRLFPHKPSRFNAVFLWEDEGDARFFKRRFRPDQHIYRVEADVEKVDIHRGDFHNTSIIGPALIDRALTYASYYWEYEPTEVAEVLYPGSVTVLQHVP